MVYTRLWIIPRLVFIFLLFVADIIFDCGTIPCAGLDPVRTNETGDFNILTDYLNTVLNKSRALEEMIYSDILNQLRSILKSENNQSEDLRKNEYKIVEERPKVKKVNQTNVFLTGSGEKERNERGRSINTTLEVVDGGYFLGYSGNPFGSRQPITGIVEMTEDDAMDPRRKRSVLHLYNMVLCTTGCNPFAYKGYGCYCGFLGSGFVVDGIDSCCKMHDWCYNSAGCPMFLEYFIPYLWKCYHHQPLCAVDHGYYGGPGSCAQRLCECDRQLALCLRRFPCPSSKAFCTSSPWRLLQNIIMF